ncbi:MAG: gliding motility-associated C-terminal domain-containing protein [Cytophagales bacterium]|nr:gliding motility-associated C-terminal domain-containing protein [Cytophagales bacterium]
MNENYNSTASFFGDLILCKIKYLMLFMTLTALMHFQAIAHTVALSATNSAPNSCSSRVITATVTGGSGNYTYYWTSEPASSVNLGNNPTITVSPSVTTTYTAAVMDNSNSNFATASIDIGKILQGSFSVSIPNAFTPNGDGVNDTWEVLDGSGGNNQLNAYKYTLTITNSSSQVVYNKTETITSGTEGLVGGYISWSGRLNGTGSIVPAGFYQYSLRLYNCSGNQLYEGTLFVLGVSSATSLIVYPNPADDYVEVMYTEMENSEPYNIQIRDQNGNPVLSQQATDKVSTVDLQGVSEGNYIISVYTSEDLHSSQLIIDH